MAVEGMVMEDVNEALRDDSEIFVCIKTPQDIQKVLVYRTSTVKQVFCATLSYSFPVTTAYVWKGLLRDAINAHNGHFVAGSEDQRPACGIVRIVSITIYAYKVQNVVGAKMHTVSKCQSPLYETVNQYQRERHRYRGSQ